MGRGVPGVVCVWKEGGGEVGSVVIEGLYWDGVAEFGRAEL